jgi:U3 small nucleolar ribonucleoprotein protein IMP3
MVRKLKHHETRLLRKHDFLSYPSLDPSHREHDVQRRYHLQPMDYSKYNALCGKIRQLAHMLSNLDPANPKRVEMESLLLERLWRMGVLKLSREQGGALSSIEKDVTVSALCRRRLGVLMVRIGMVENVSTAHKFIVQGHVRVGTEMVSDPAYLVPRGREEFVTWGEGSKVKRRVEGYKGREDDYELL